MTKILVVEDDPKIRTALCVRLHAAGYEAVPVSEGTHAAEVTLVQQPDTVLLDISMPGKNGFEVAEELRANPATATIPLVFLTASHQAGFPDRAMDLGATAFVQKPYDADILLATIRAAVTGRAAA